MIHAAEHRYHPIDFPAEDLARPTPLARRVYRLRGTLVAPAIFAAAVAAWNAHPRPVDLAVGACTFLLGWAVRAWAQRHLAYRLRRRMHLTCCGPYRWVRNPV